MHNLIIIGGRLAQDPKFINGHMNGSVRIYSKNADNETENHYFNFSLPVSEERAAKLKEIMVKDTVVQVTGSLNEREWKSKDGSAGSVFEVNATNIVKTDGLNSALGSIRGTLAREPERRGKIVTTALRFPAAYDKNAEKQRQIFLECVFFGTIGDNMEKYFHKGDAVILNGNLTTNSYINKEGKKITTPRLLVNTFADKIVLRNNDSAEAAPAAPADSVADYAVMDDEEGCPFPF